MINNGKAALVAAALITMMSCTQKNETQADNGYIGPSDIKIEDGRMTPEALLSLGRLSDPQLVSGRTLDPLRSQLHFHRGKPLVQEPVSWRGYQE